jgi:hypothetical protein
MVALAKEIGANTAIIFLQKSIYEQNLLLSSPLNIGFPEGDPLQNPYLDPLCLSSQRLSIS